MDEKLGRCRCRAPGSLPTLGENGRMDIVGWLLWLVSAVFSGLLSLIWFLISGWVSTLLQIGLLVVVIYFLKYGWQRAPAELWRRSRSFAGFFVSWIRARDAQG